jgi:hypothetical protein
MFAEEWFPPCAIRRIICHSEDVEEVHDDLRICYHFLITKSGAVARGLFSLVDNAAPRRGYACHTHALNIGSAGVLVVGKSPNERQWDSLINLVAHLCKRYSLSISERTVLCHSEVERVYFVPQRGADDLHGMGDALRSCVHEVLNPHPDEPSVFQQVLVRRQKMVGLVDNGAIWVPARHLANQFSASFNGTSQQDNMAHFVWGSEGFTLPARKAVIYGVEYICVSLRAFLSCVGWDCRYDERRNILVVSDDE